MTYKISFGLGIYEAKRDLDEILKAVSSEEIDNLQNFVMRSFTEYYNRLKRESIKFEKEQLKTEINLGLKTEEEYLKELRKIEERENKINDEVERYLKQNLKLEFNSKYPTLLTYSIEQITRTGWLISDRLIFENGKIRNKELMYHGKNFKYYNKDDPLIKLWNSIIEEYFKLLSKYDI